MAKKIYEQALADLRDEQNEEEVFSNGSLEKFFDFLEPAEVEKFHEMEEMAEEKRKWLRQFDKLQAQIAAGDFSEALETFGILSEDMELE